MKNVYMKLINRIRLIVAILSVLLSQNMYAQENIDTFLHNQLNDPEKPIDFKIAFADTTFIGAALDAKAEKYKSVLESYDVSFKAPNGFNPIDMRGRDRILPMITKDEIVDLCYFLGYESADNNVVILFPYFGSKSAMTDSIDIDVDKKYYIERELRVNAKDPQLDVAPLINVISEPDMNNYSNADTAYVYYLNLFPDSELYLGSYNNCIGVYLQKEGHPALPLKVLFTDKVKDKAMQYVNELLSCIRYGDRLFPENN